MITRPGMLLLFVVGCASNETSGHDYVLTGDACKVYSDRETCTANDGCNWYAIGAPCREGETCPSGVCQGNETGSGSSGGGSGGGTATGCACPGTGGVCFEQIGGLPTPTNGSGPEISCSPATNCAAIPDQGNCVADPNVTNLCICDNGIR